MKRKHCIIVQTVLLIWFFLNMTGVYFGDVCLVTRSYKDDGIFFLIYLMAVILFVVKEKIGKWAIIIWTSMWFITQFISHEWYTIFNDGFMGTLESKIDTFSGTMHWLKIEDRYVPDIYHTILHVLILLVLVSTSMYATKNRKK
ncbi:hypothetical protein [Extibacter muris]|uniref:hypothetical protein n=1 Tax=Extibacter muris TaxID=1796622 RepID=UPI001D0915AC|nr:hypothetical protein [Extibacter muris]MCB6203105.1 hypothetical protein [Extibacter muris]MCQ4664330.1 hypothetical protein [Extibacter muris]MCQ4692332.1 hypothetical protein [Extibacter muris]MCQ4692423.1 hypothetical protein [Extibacter muris]